MTTRAETRVIDALTEFTNRSSYQLATATNLSTCRLYATLNRLEKEGKITSTWEEIPPDRYRRYKLATVEETHYGT